MSYIKTIFTGLVIVSLLPTQVFAATIVERQAALDERVQTVLDRVETWADAREYRSDRVVVKIKGEDRFRLVPVASGRSVSNTLTELNRNKNVEYAEPDYIATKTATPNDPYYSPYQWHLDNPTGSGINAEEAWDITTGSPDVIVAVIDTGVAYEDRREGRSRYYQAPDLANTCFVSGYDFINNDPYANDDEGHGTHVAGTIAQSTNNNLGVAGVAYDTCVMPVKALDATGSGSYSAIANGIYFAVDNGADIINMSLGGTADSSTLEDAVAYAYNNGVTVIAAAGNSNTSAPHYPSSYNSYVISVGATDYTKARAPYSNYGPDVDIAAPGGNTSVDANGDGYVDGVLQQTFGTNTGDLNYFFYQGTSMASPHAAGVAALLMAHGNATTPDEIRAALESTAQDIGDPSLGAGLIDAYAALLWTAGPVDESPTVAVTNPLANEIVSGTVVLSANATDDIEVASVEFFVNGVLIGTDVIAPYELSWDSTSVSDGDYTVSARATDSVGQTAEDAVGITVDNINDAPVADAGSDVVVMDSDDSGSETITLDGSNSYDPDGTIVSFVWTQNGLIIATTSTAEVVVPVGTSTYTLIVQDNDGAQGTDTVSVTVEAYVNQAPVAQAGPNQTLSDNDGTGDEAVTLDGSLSSDADGAIESYVWTVNGSVIATSTSVVVNQPVGNTTYTLTVTDNKGTQGSDTVTVTVQENLAPVAQAGVDQSALVDMVVTFNGSGSFDSDGSLISYAWDFGDGSTATGETTSHIYATEGVYTATLTVTDNGGKTAVDTATITVTATEPITLEAVGYKDRGRHVTDLTWSGITTSFVDIYRDGNLIKTTTNVGSYTDRTSNRGGATYTYQVCEENTSNCSNEVSVTF